jgi:hypothetical protein
MGRPARLGSRNSAGERSRQAPGSRLDGRDLARRHASERLDPAAQRDHRAATLLDLGAGEPDLVAAQRGELLARGGDVGRSAVRDRGGRP